MVFKMENYFIAVIIITVNSIVQVIAETCSNGETCESPYTCCDGNCCHDNDDDYVYGYRMSFWNLWYFWFVILFVLMSCFGGCGYYKQRQRILRGRTGSPSRNRRSRTIILTRTGETNAAPYAYSGPGAESYNNAYQPPPYSEVMLHPGLYPTNKQNLPPYPDDGRQDTTEAVPINQDVVLPQPPPYTEIANQNTDVNQAANQISGSQTQTVYQNTSNLQGSSQETNYQSNQDAAHTISTNQNAS